jgi:hypothetical protein
MKNDKNTIADSLQKQLVETLFSNIDYAIDDMSLHSCNDWVVNVSPLTFCREVYLSYLHEPEALPVKSMFMVEFDSKDAFIGYSSLIGDEQPSVAGDIPIDVCSRLIEEYASSLNCQ